ncbi:MAG TPA: acetoin utilization protein AcuC [Micromonosporaceae bacterium]|jgi:acetoin utilization protein AcuC
MTATVVWGDELLAYDLGDHPLDPVRVELTIALSRMLGVLDRPGVRVVAPEPADDAAITRVHDPRYVDAVKVAGEEMDSAQYGLGTGDNPVFDRMHEASALVAGASIAAAEAVWREETVRAVNIAGGLHHAMPDHASGFCVYNDPAIAITRLLDLGAEHIAYVDVDVHHGDGVQAIFWDDPRVLTVSLHETPLALFPGTGFPHETGGPKAPGTAVNVALPPGTDDGGWLRAFHAVVPSVLRAFRPQILFTQCGADTYHIDPLADLKLTVDGQRASHIALRALADELCGGRWVALGGGGYALVEAVPRTWTHLLATLTGESLDPRTLIPREWQELARERLAGAPHGRLRLLRDGPGVPTTLTDGGQTAYRAWTPGDGDTVGRAITATRNEVFPLLGLDPHDPRD